eukprot:s2652_g10.t1
MLRILGRMAACWDSCLVAVVLVVHGKANYGHAGGIAPNLVIVAKIGEKERAGDREGGFASASSGGRDKGIEEDLQRRASSELGSSATATETAGDWKCHSCRDHLLAHCSLSFVDPVPRYQMLAAGR